MAEKLERGFATRRPFRHPSVKPLVPPSVHRSALVCTPVVKRALAAFPLSLLVHAIAIALLVFWPRDPRPPKKASPQKVAVRKISAKEWAQARAVPIPKGQIVDVAPGNHRRPEEARFIAETNNTVARETKAKDLALKVSRVTPKTAPNPEAAQAPKGNVGGASAPALAPPSFENFGGGQPKRLTQLLHAARGKEQNVEVEEKAGADDGTAAPTPESDATDPGGGAFADKLDVPEGAATALNTNEWKYAAFFNRVKQSVSAKWDPMRRAPKMSAHDRTTVLGVSLRPDGTIVDLYVTESSGLEALDIEAMQAFEKAAPFPNPPAALVHNGFIRFAFSFNVMNQGSRF